MPEADAKGVAQYGELSGTIALNRFGFRSIIAWHYLVLFSPLLVEAGGNVTTDILFSRQMYLYCSLSLAFALFSLISKITRKHATDFISSPVTIIIACLFGAISTFLVGFYPGQSPEYHIITTVLLGFSEAFLMYLWLHYYTSLAKVHAYKTLGMDVIIGSVIAFFVASLVNPSNAIVAAMLPLIGAISLFSHKKRYDTRVNEYDGDAKVTTEESPSEQGVEASSGKVSTTFLRSALTIAIVIVFALVVGLLQGTYAGYGIALLFSYNQVSLLGIALAGIVIYLVPQQPCTRSDTNIMYRFSLAFFIFGIGFLLAAQWASVRHGMESSIFLVVANFMILAGFNLFDFGSLTHSLNSLLQQNRLYANHLDTGRILVYACLALGLFVGWTIMQIQIGEDSSTIVNGISCAAIVFLAATILLPHLEEDSPQEVIARIIREGQDSEECKQCVMVESCEAHARVVDNFKPTVAGEDSVQDDSKISSGARAGRVQSAVSHKDTSLASESGNDDEKAQSTLSSHALSQDTVDETAAEESVMEEIVNLYRLSKRETEVFGLISKGRNAEFVSNELFISIHTAKTHIANIYQKLDVHSSQELLDLIDEFRAGQKV